MIDEKPNSVGRPTKYRKWMNEAMEDELASGHSIQGSCPILGVSSATVYTWLDLHPEFLESTKRGLDKGLRYLEKLMDKKLTGDRKVDGNMLQFALRTRFHKVYSEKQQIEHSGKIEMPIAKDEEGL